MTELYCVQSCMAELFATLLVESAVAHLVVQQRAQPPGVVYQCINAR